MFRTENIAGNALSKACRFLSLDTENLARHRFPPLTTTAMKSVSIVLAALASAALANTAPTVVIQSAA
jgi:hypothetical protein